VLTPRKAKARDGVAVNSWITAATAVVLLVLLAAEGATIPWIGSLRSPHVIIGLVLLAPVAVKLASTGYRFLRYYTGAPAYRRKGPPPLPLRLLAPGVVLTTIALFATGVALEIVGENDQLAFFHKLSFIAWFGFMSIHVLGHLLELPRLLARRSLG
jgi:hypothetical protein